MSFIFGGNTGYKASDLPRLRAALQQQQSNRVTAPRNLGEGLTALGQALSQRLTHKGLQQAQADQQRQSAAQASNYQHALKVAQAGDFQGPDAMTVAGMQPPPGMEALHELILKRQDPSYQLDVRKHDEQLDLDQAKLDLATKQAGDTAAQAEPEHQAAVAAARESAKFKARMGAVQDVLGRPMTEEEALQFMMPQAGVTVNTGDGAANPYSYLDKKMAEDGLVPKLDESGKHVLGENGAPQYINTTGTKADNQEYDAAKMVSAEQDADNVNIAIDRISEILDWDDEHLPALQTTTSTIGWGAAKIPGTLAYQISQHLSTLKSNAAFTRLSEIRAASKTGGGVGQLSDNEAKLLADTFAAIEVGMPADELRKSLEVLRNYFGDRQSAAKTAYALKYGDINFNNYDASKHGDIPEGVDPQQYLTEKARATAEADSLLEQLD